MSAQAARQSRSFFAMVVAAIVLFLGGAQWVRYRMARERSTQLARHLSSPQSSTIERLVAQGADPNTRSVAGTTPLHAAVVLGDLRLAEKLLRAGARVNERGFWGSPPLTQAVRWGLGELAAFLLAHGADPNQVDDRGFTPVDQAVEEGREEMVQLLLAPGKPIPVSGAIRLQALSRARRLRQQDDRNPIPPPGRNPEKMAKIIRLLKGETQPGE